MEELKLVGSFIANTGVPAAVAFYCLTAINRNLDKLVQSIDKLEIRVEMLEKAFGRGGATQC